MHPTIDRFDISVKLAAMLLMHDGAISIKDIESIPSVGDREEAYAVARRLVDGFNETYQVEVIARGDSNVEIVLAETSLHALFHKRTAMSEDVIRPPCPVTAEP